jgi:CheY-like chemotaxis protein
MNTRKKVLILNTHADFLIVLQQILEDEGFETTATWDVREALALLSSQHFDAVLVDEHPPEIKPAELLKWLRAHAPRVECIVLESDSRHPFQAQYLCSLGARAVVPKWKHKRIVEAVRQNTAARLTGGQCLASA